MPTDAEDSGFISRWSRRKALVRQGVGVADAVPPLAPTDALSTSQSVAQSGTMTPAPSSPAAAMPANDAAQVPSSPADEQAPPAPTLADVAALTRDSDFSRFVTRGVQPDVKNAALGKLFTDPHFNVMDRLDVYIDDYSQPDPLPAGMLRQMVQAHVLGLFDHEKEVPAPDHAETQKIDAATPVLTACDAALPNEPAADENTDLQLQPDDGAGRIGTAPGAGEDAGCAH